jgi:hypothetical protein
MKLPIGKIKALAEKAPADPMEPDADDRPAPKKKGKVKRSMFKKGGASGGECY